MIVLRRQLYSLVEEEERDYSILSDLWKKGKKGLIKKLNDKIKKYDTLSSEFNGEAIKIENEELSKLLEDKNLIDGLKEEAQKRNIGILGDSKFGRGLNRMEQINLNNRIKKALKNNGKDEDRENYQDLMKRLKELKENISNKDSTGINFLENNNIDLDEIKDSKDYKLSRKGDSLHDLVSELDKTKTIIGFGGHIGPASTLTHEIGHYDNRHGKFTKHISKIAENSKGDDSIFGSVKRRIFQPIEENNAWKNGKKILKKRGATQEKLDVAENARKANLKSYKYSGNKDVLETIKRKLNK